MKFLIVLALMTSSVFAAPSTAKRAAPVNKDIEAIKKEAAKKTDKKEADCDEKAKKPIEIKAESISLGGNTGCSLDDAH